MRHMLFYSAFFTSLLLPTQVTTQMTAKILPFTSHLPKTMQAQMVRHDGILQLSITLSGLGGRVEDVLEQPVEAY